MVLGGFGFIMKISQSQLEDRVNLVRWQQGVARQRFSLLTIHSLLLDHNPKFKHLKQIIQNFNQETSPARIKLQQSYIQRLFKMLSELTRIPLAENQQEYLDKIYQWATTANNHQGEEAEGVQGEKVRPVTATTKARSQSAYSRATTARPISGHFQKKTKNQELPPLNTIDTKIDYSKLKDGEKEFYCGLRSIHPEYGHPKKRLKDYQRKVFYEDEDDSDVEVIELEPPVVVNEQKLIQEIEMAQEEALPEEGVEGQEGGAEQNVGDVNIDDIPIQGQEEAGDGQPEQEQEIIDKLRPKVKVYNNPKGINDYSHKNYQHAMDQLRRDRNQHQRRVDQDVELAQFGALWAQGKARSKSELKRRAESARMFKNRIGITYQKPPPPQTAKERENIVSFQNVAPHNVNIKGVRPQTAFTATSKRARDQLIQNAFISGKLTGHVKKSEPTTALSIPSQFNIVGTSLANHAGPPKKKTFEQILRQAEERVARQAQEQVMGVKQVFAKNKISMGANKIAKSISYQAAKELTEQQQFAGLITGMTMLKNPFIKVAKKKKKKKKK